MNLLLNKIKFIVVAIAMSSFIFMPVQAEKLTNMVEEVLSNHEDIVNSKKELEEANRDVTDALLVYAPDLSVK